MNNIFDIYETLEDFIELPGTLDDLPAYREEYLEVLERTGYTIEDVIILNSLIEFHKKRIEMNGLNEINIELEDTQETEGPEWLKDIFKRESIEQRTEDWYKQAATMITASEFNTILKPGRTRGHIVLSKVNPQPKPVSRPVPSEMMTPFDWGIRFEPVIKQIYEYKYNSQILDVGRLVHRTDPRIGASPDGIVVSGPKKGRLIEIKCPISREVGKGIPQDYYVQMQLQLEVTGADICDYVECRLRSLGGRKSANEPDKPLLSGIMWRVSKGTEDEKYIYGPISGTVDSEPMLEEDEHVLEVIPWELMEWVEIEVKRDPEWWKSVQPAINEFWKDVEMAHKGKFELPEAKRKTKKQIKPEDECMF
jgi:putative phage-type endonuclease